MTVPTCDCEPWTIDVDEDGEPEVVDHEADCPRYYDHLHTAKDIAAFRQYIMVWNEQADGHHRGGDAFFHRHREISSKMATGVTARAIELGLEQP